MFCSLEIEIYNNTSNYLLFLSRSLVVQSLEIFLYMNISTHCLCSTFCSTHKFSKAILKGRYSGFISIRNNFKQNI